MGKKEKKGPNFAIGIKKLYSIKALDGSHLKSIS